MLANKDLQAGDNRCTATLTCSSRSLRVNKRPSNLRNNRLKVAKVTSLELDRPAKRCDEGATAFPSPHELEEKQQK